ncbi:MAG: elongation factor, partial [Chloroflexota bacterium]|nr:elongation factor [Chloroflexota bacterium]
KYKVPRIAFINKMDRMGADFYGSLASIQSKLGANAVAIQLPIGSEAEFNGVIDLVNEEAIVYTDDLGTTLESAAIPENMKEKVHEYRQILIEKAADYDDEIMHAFLEEQPVDRDRLMSAIRKGTVSTQMVPVIAGAALRNRGVQPMLDAVVDYLPSPLDMPAVEGLNPKSEHIEVRGITDEQPFAALAFKVATDPYVGKLTFFRVYSGTLKAGSYVYNATKGHKERIGRLLQMHANHREELEDVYAGDIAAAIGLKNTTTGDSLTAENHPLILENITFPEPVIAVAVEPKTKADQEKMGIALQRLAEEDPTFRVHTEEETGQTIIEGMGELHLEVIVDRMLREFSVDANVGKPQVSYRETIRREAKGTGRFVRQSGGRGQYGHAEITIEPNEAGKGFEFIDKIVGGKIPREYIAPVGKGIEEALENGILAGFPMVDVKATLYDGSYHDVDSNEMAFHIAGSMAVKDAVHKANPVLLEPIMKVEVSMPEEFMGDVMGDLSARRGHILGMEGRGTSQSVKANVPLANMFGYVNELRSMTQGRASYAMEFDHYEEVPKSVAEEIIAKSRS